MRRLNVIKKHIAGALKATVLSAVLLCMAVVLLPLVIIDELSGGFVSRIIDEGLVPIWIESWR